RIRLNGLSLHDTLPIYVASWPAGSQPHAWREPPFIAPTLDLYVAFHELVPESEYLLVDGHSPTGADGLIGFTTRVWSEDRRLVRSEEHTSELQSRENLV